MVAARRPAGVVAVPSGPVLDARASSPEARADLLGLSSKPTRALRSTGDLAPAPDRVSTGAALPAVAALLVVLPVFVQAPWVRLAPMAAALFTALLVTAGVLLERQQRPGLSQLGALLVGFSGCWLGGCLFWGWARLHPLWHLPVEGFALPLALAGLRARWRLACGFYLASLLGTAATDGAMAFSGVIDLWPRVLSAPLADAPQLLQSAALTVLQPLPLLVVALSAALLMGICGQLQRRGPVGRIAAATLATTLAVDGLFLTACLFAPNLSGLL